MRTGILRRAGWTMVALTGMSAIVWGADQEAESLGQPSTLLDVRPVAQQESAAEGGPETTLPPIEVRPEYEPVVSEPGPTSGGGYGGAGQAGAGASGPLNGLFGTPISWGSGAIYSDSQLVGPYQQPVWTTQRPWATTRVYVLPPGQAQVEQWVRPTYPRGEKPEFRFLEEFAIGLPGRFQLDLYERWNIEPNDQNMQEANHEGTQIELRWAVADWGQIPLNPTLYAEWVERGGPQEKPNVYELKLLLGDQLAENLYYATNLVLEQETSGELEQEFQWSHAISRTVIDRVLMAGIEMNLTSTTVHGGRGEHENGFIIGPSLQLRPTNRTFLDVVGLFGTNSESPDARMFIIFGYQFGLRAGPSVRAPASTIGN
ncbi:MAG: hypothetical protein U0795_06705 [Pirellulales bacterium]